MSTLTIVLLTASLMLVYCSAFEWTLHKYFMHKPFMGFRYPYRQHAQVHHHIFKADASYHLSQEKDKWTIPMAWWNWMILLPVALILPSIGAFFSGHFWLVFIIALIVTGGYYAAYEGMHWCMHFPLPRKRLIEKIFLPFKWLNGHHILHHRYMGKNFNVVLPVMDILTGTFLYRSPVTFAQPRGPLVRDVQPKKKISTRQSEKKEELVQS